MTCNEARQKSIVDFLSNQGVQFVRVNKNRYYWYKSPIRENDQQPSFFVDSIRNQWYDKATSEGGNIIDLAQRMTNGTIETALQLIAGTRNYNYAPLPTNDVISIKKENVYPIRNKALIAYLTTRKIPLQLAQKYLLECYFKAKPEQTKPYFALCFENDKQGYEIRNKYYKGSTTPKYFTTIVTKATKSINVFEGVFDFLSALVHYKTDTPSHTTIVLNSISFVNATLPIIQQYDTVNLYLDNDEAGQKTLQTYQTQHKNVIHHAATVYPLHKDFNEYLCSQ